MATGIKRNGPPLAWHLHGLAGTNFRLSHYPSLTDREVVITICDHNFTVRTTLSRAGIGTIDALPP
jgi:hypothetical protein